MYRPAIRSFGSQVYRLSDSPLTLYAVATGLELAHWRLNHRPAATRRWLAPSPDGGRLALIDGDGSTHILRIIRQR